LYVNNSLWGVQGASTSGYVAVYNGTSSLTGYSGFTADASGNINVASLYASGNVTAYSDQRLKTNVETIQNALDKTSALRGVTYNRIADNAAKLGVIAQEVQQVIPEVVIEGADGMLSVDYGNIVGLLIEAIKELRAELDAVKQSLSK
jgi:hypothetical protein